jgi:dihydroorotate dehydrogenase
MYKLIRPLFFLLDAETAHQLAMKLLKILCRVGIFRAVIKALFSPGMNTRVEQWGLSFTNPVGLGAGFDKNARYLRELQLLGFGFVEIGTVTPLPQAGNVKPRLFRLPKDKALINRMGFNNDGAREIAERLKEWKNKNAGDENRLIIGGNIGKNKLTPNEGAWMDYERCFLQLFDYVD